jgi:phage terminase large subunit-like protein
LVDDPIVRISRAKTSDNPHLAPEMRERLYEMYGNTRVGLQELEAQILEEVTGALWTQELIEQHRVTSDQVPPLRRVRTYVDPSWGTTNDECGIIVAGLAENKHIYILADLSKRTTPAEWGLIAALGYLPAKGVNPADAPFREWYGKRSERVVFEANYQGEQVRLVARATAREINRRIICKPVIASRGNRIRAEPVHMLYERGRCHHVGHFPGLEFQLTNWIPPEVSKDSGDPGDPQPALDGDPTEGSGWSPDRLDALVFAGTDLGFSAVGLNWRNPGGETVHDQPDEVIGPEPMRPRIPTSIRVPTRSATPHR